MNFKRIAVIDSGIGGISVLKELVNEFPKCDFIYFGDNKNAPYGNRTVADLYSISLSNLSYILSFQVDAVVFACNTVSVSVLQFLRPFSPVPLFGIYPPIESEMVKGNSVLLLATDVTADKYKGLKNVVSVGLSGLVKQIEDNKFRLENLPVAEFLPSNKKFFHTVILGCTHFNFLKNQIFNHFCPQNMKSGVENVVLNIKKVFQKSKSIDKTYRNSVLFVGENAEENQKFWLKING
ncbi:MAG: hypothetical protein E7362_03555 [Clostridiales bacterium]|nr:hypothetical protein [Clostridiales bacterium]